jgi:hypothetical protein
MLKKLTSPAVVLACASASAQAAFIDPGFSGTTDYDEWDNLTVTNPQVASAPPPGK